MNNYYMMDEKQAERIRSMVGWIRLILLLVLLFLIGVAVC